MTIFYAYKAFAPRFNRPLLYRQSGGTRILSEQDS